MKNFSSQQLQQLPGSIDLESISQNIIYNSNDDSRQSENTSQSDTEKKLARLPQPRIRSSQMMTNQPRAKGKKPARSFTRSEDQLILNLILKFGPKFKRVSRALNGRTLNMIKNHYYRDLRFRWHEVLGQKYAHLNEKKEEVTFNSLLTGVPLDSDLKMILYDCFAGVEKLICTCLETTPPQMDDAIDQYI